MAKPDIWMPLYIGDYLADTMHLNAEQHGAYLLLIMAYWKAGGAISSNDQSLASTCRLSPDAWSMHKHTLASFFDTDSDPKLWIHVRAEKEIEKAGNNQEKRTLRAKKAAEARWSNDAPSNAPSNAQAYPQAMLNECPSPSPSDKEQKEGSLRSPQKKLAVKKNQFELPTWIGSEPWKSFVEMRNKIKKPMTENAMGLAVKALEKLEAQGHRADDVLNQSTFNSWQGLFAIKQDYSNGQNDTGRNRQGRPSLVEQVRQANAHHFHDEPSLPDERSWPEFERIREVNGQVVDADD